MTNVYQLKNFGGNTPSQDVASFFAAIHQVSPCLQRPGECPQLLHKLKLANEMLQKRRVSDGFRGDGLTLSEAQVVGDAIRATLLHEYQGDILRTAHVTYKRIST